MNVIPPIIFLIFSTLLGALVARPLTDRFKSGPMTVVTSWFVGQYLSAFCVYYLAVGLVGIGQSHVLFKAAALFSVVVSSLALLLSRGAVVRSLCAIIARIRNQSTWGDTLPCLGAFLFATFFFISKLWTDEGVIKTAGAYWDFPVHVPIIQGFVLGDNFPAQNNSLSGVPLTYHFFFDFLISIYAALGLDLVGGVNAVTTVALGVLFSSVFGFTTEMFGSRKAGVLAMALTATSGSLRFIYDLQTALTHSFSHWFASLSDNPYQVADLPNNVAGYNGNMFNMFYFLAERQMIFASIFLLISMVVLYHRRSLPSVALLGIGVAAGWFMQWHLFVTISVLMMIGTSVVLGPQRRSSGLLLFGMTGIVALFVFEMRDFVKSDLFFPDIRDYPRFNPDFPTNDPLNPQGGYPLTPLNFIWYYLFAYGIKFFLIPFALVQLWKRERGLAIIFISLAVPTFIAINTVQLSPLSVYDNHKWLRPLNVALDILVAWVVITTFFSGSTLGRRTLGAGAILLCTLGGAIELYPYLRPVKGTRQEVVYSPRHTPLTDLLETATPRRSTLLTGNTLESHLAGRLTFFSNPFDEVGATGMTASFRINESGRGIIRAKVYNAPTLRELCEAAQTHHIDYVEQSEVSPDILARPADAHARPAEAQWPLLSAVNRRGEIISLLDIATLCKPDSRFQEKAAPEPIPFHTLSSNERERAIALSSLTPTIVKAGLAEPQANKSFSNRPLELAGKRYDSGVGLHAPIQVRYAVPSDMSFFSGVVGLDDEISHCSFHSVVVRFVDEKGAVVFNSGLLVSPKEPRPFVVDVRGKKEITIIVTDSGDGHECDHLDVADAFFTKLSPR